MTLGDVDDIIKIRDIAMVTNFMKELISISSRGDNFHHRDQGYNGAEISI